MTIDPHREALTELLDAYARDWRAGGTVGAALCKRKGVKEAFAPLAKLFKANATAERVLQRILESDPEDPLHQAARALALAGALPSTPWLSIAGAPQPKRWTTQLVLSRRSPVVYAIEIDARVAVWSLETGAHLEDLALPGGKKNRAIRLHEQDDGVLRVLAADGTVLERPAGGKTLVKALATRELRWSWVASPDLRWVAVQLEFQPIEDDGVKSQKIGIFDALRRSSTELRLPIDYPEGGFHWVDVAGGRIVLAGRRSVELGGDEWREDHSLFVVDPATATYEAIAFPCEIQQVQRGARPETLRLGLIHRAGDEERFEEVEYDLVTRTQTPAAADEGGAWWIIPMDGGRRFDPQTGRVLDAAGAVIGGHALAEDPYKRIAVWDGARGQLVLAGGDPAAPVVVVRPYDPRGSSVVTANEAPAAPPAPLEWARAGVVLTYAIADFDAADEYTFEVLAADDGLTLAIKMDDEEVAAAARFTAAALASATKSVAIAQGGADVDLGAAQAKALPPILIARTSAAKLAAGKALAWKSEWSEPGKLEGASRSVETIEVDGAARPVATITASSDEVTLTILDDPTWPLVIARVEGDSHVRLEGVDTTRAAASVAPPKAAAASEPAPGAAGVARRFEAREGAGGKFWEVAVEGPALTVRFGKIGASGTVQTKTLASAEAAVREQERLIREKTKKGYTPV